MKFLSYYSKDFFQIHIPWGKKYLLLSCTPILNFLSTFSQSCNKSSTWVSPFSNNFSIDCALELYPLYSLVHSLLSEHMVLESSPMVRKPLLHKSSALLALQLNMFFSQNILTQAQHPNILSLRPRWIFLRGGKYMK